MGPITGGPVTTGGSEIVGLGSMSVGWVMVTNVIDGETTGSPPPAVVSVVIDEVPSVVCVDPLVVSVVDG